MLATGNEALGDSPVGWASVEAMATTTSRSPCPQGRSQTDNLHERGHGIDNRHLHACAL
ncbi:hypothetical protein PT2222_570003 [Paraburkholderia tropica]